MADNAFVKIGIALLKHQVKKLVGEETLGVISDELADIGGDKLDSWLGDKSTIEEIEKAAETARDNFRGKVNDDEVEQWMVMLPVHNLPSVLSAIEELPTSPDETKLENALSESIALNWVRLSAEQVNNAVNAFLSCLRSALLPIERQTLMIIGRSVLRTEDKVNLLIRWFEQYIITGKPVQIKQLNSEPVATWYLAHPYPMPPNFTGRVEERKMLADWLNNDNENRLFILRALGGFGKSALTWHWLTHDVDSKEYPKVVFWSFYEGDASFEHFIEETLKYLKLDVPQGQRPQVDELLKAMQGGKILLIMDGFERALRAYSSMNAAYQGDEPKVEDNQLDCVNLNAEIFLKSVCSLPNIKSKILMTTRLTPRCVKPRGEFMLGCREVELTSMQPADAIEFFHKQKIKGTHAEIEVACAPYGYHPLSLRLLAGRILKDFEKPADIVVAQSLKIDGDIVQQKHHVLEVSYNSLPPDEQKLLSTIACFRSPVELKTLQSITENKNTLDNDLQDLRERGLLHFDEKNKKFDLHPIVRRFAYERLTASDRAATHTRLRDYFAPIDIPPKIQTIVDLAPIIELYHHTVRAGELDKAFELYYDRLSDSLYYQLGTYQTIIELLRVLFPNGESNPPRLNKELAQAWVLTSLANAYSSSGESRRAIPLVKQQNILQEKNDHKTNLARGYTNLADDQLKIGLLSAAEANLKQRIEISLEVQSEHDEAVGHVELGQLLVYRGKLEEAEQELFRAHELFEKRENFDGLCSVGCYQSSRLLQMKKPKTALIEAQNAFKAWKEDARRTYPTIGTLVLTLWSLGAAYLRDSQFDLADQNLSEAIERARAINAVDKEANIILDLARLSYDQKNYEVAKSLAEEALLIAERCGYVLQGADVNLFLAQYALEQEKDKAKAKQYAEEAKKLATCDGPPYYYKVAYEEAERMLEKL